MSWQAPLRCRPVAPAWEVPSLAEDLRNGFSDRPRSLPPKYFYDARGSALFARICETEEYYLTRSEAGLLRRHAAEVLALARPAHLIELGSGDAKKTRVLLDAYRGRQRRLTYWPFDLCEPMLLQTARRLVSEFPWLSVQPLSGDYSAGLANLPSPGGTCLYAFLGSTIGNLDRSAALRFLLDLVQCMEEGDWLLLGADRIKAPEVLHAAYNDAEGVTAAFNLNVLGVLNRELGGDFVPERYAHQALYNPREAQIEMYLVARVAQRVRFAALDFEVDLDAGERILTEISRKYSREGIEALLAEVGLAVVRHFEAAAGRYSLLLARRSSCAASA